MQRWGALIPKERCPLPEEKMILLRTAQVRVLFEACNLRLDCRELTLKSADLPALARQQLLFFAFHDALHMHSNAIALPQANARKYAGDNSAPKLCLFFASMLIRE
jgi:hypothetical protein